MYSNVDYVVDFTNFSEYDAYVEANFDIAEKQAKKDGPAMSWWKDASDEERKSFIQGRANVYRAQYGKEARDYRDSTRKMLTATSEDRRNKRVEAAGKQLVSQSAAQEKYANEVAKAKKLIDDIQSGKVKGNLGEAQDTLAKFERKLNGTESAIKRLNNTLSSNSTSKSSGFHLIPSSTGGKVAAGAGAAALATLGSLAVAGSKGIGPMATDNAKIARANRLIAKGQIDKANKILDSVKDKSKLVQTQAPQAYAASEAE